MTDGIRCTACHHPETTREPYFYEWDGGHHDLRRCPVCTHQFVHPPVTPEQQAAIYGDQYFEADGDWAVGWWGQSYEEATAHLEKEAQEVLPLLEPHGGRLLDVGCAGGTFLAAARAAGFDVEGVEINPAQAERARARYGLRVHTSRIEDLPPMHSPGFNVVTLMDVLEHVPEPLDALRLLHGWIRPGGRLFIRGPIVTGGLARAKDTLRRLTGLRKRLPGYPLDANQFNARSLRSCLDAAGFDGWQWYQTAGFVQVVAVRGARRV